jgi:WD40 repeat protein
MPVLPAIDTKAPIRGAIIPVEGGGLAFVTHEAKSAGAADGAVIVEANTGVWLHDPATLERKERLAPSSVTSLAVSPDGHTIAWTKAGRGATAQLEVISFPERKRLLNEVVDAPWRLRFAPDGKRVVLASRRAESVLVVDIASRKTWRIDEKDDVNDAIVLPDNEHVAAAHDGDDAVVQKLKNGGLVFHVGPHMHPHKVFTRDQNAVAYDPAGDVFAAGGDDNVVWRFKGVLGAAPTMDKPLDFDGNVEEILFSKPKGADAASMIVATDRLLIQVLNSHDVTTASLGPLGSSLVRNPIRIALTQEGEILAALDGSLVLWSPQTGANLVAQGFAKRTLEWQSSRTAADEVIVLPVDATHLNLYRVSLKKEEPDLTIDPLTTLDLHDYAGNFAFASGARAIVGLGDKRQLRVIYLNAGAPNVEAPIDGEVLNGLRYATRPDALSIAVLDTGGALFEISDSPRGITKLGSVGDVTNVDVHPAWDAQTRRWTVVGVNGESRPLTP